MATPLRESDLPTEHVTGQSELTVSRWFADTLVRWRLIALGLGLAILAGVLAAIFIPPVYSSRVSFVANSSGGTRLPAALSSGPFAGIASQLGMATGSDPSESPNFYIQLIQSRELLSRLLQSRFRDPRGSSGADSAQLIEILRVRGPDRQYKMEKGLKKISKSITGNFDNTTNLVWLDVDAQWPDLSSAVANRTIDLVADFNREQRVSRVRSRRVFLQGRVVQARGMLDVAENRIRLFNEQNRSWRASPALVFEEQQLQRERERAAELYGQLERQLEVTLLEEVNDAARITVVDSAVPPRRADWPRYGVLAASTLISGLFLGFLLAGGAAVVADWRARNPMSANHMAVTMRSLKKDVRHPFK